MGLMDFFKKVIPGYKGYKEREDSRNSDKLLREFLANKLREGRSRYDDVKAEIANRGALDLLKPAEKVTQTLTRVMDRLRYANYGFSGKWWGTEKFGIERIEQVHEFDKNLVEGVENLVKGIAAVEQLDDNGEINTALKNLAGMIRDMDEALNRREEILRAMGAEGDKEES